MLTSLDELALSCINKTSKSQILETIKAHNSGTVASRYGSGYNTDIMRKALEKVWL